MIIGYIAPFRNPNKLCNLIAKISIGNGINVLYINPKDINKKEHKVKGRLYVNNQWLWVNCDLPEIIDLRPYYLKKEDKHIIPYLESKCVLTDYGRNFITKEQLQKAMPHHSELASLAIPTQALNRFEDIVEFFNENDKAIIKPVHSLRGVGIYLLEKKENLFILKHYTEEKVVNLDELKALYNEKIKGRKHILQKYIQSRTKQGDPFDCRIHLEKNGMGYWELAKKYIRIGIGQKVISNVNQGGGIAEIKPFLKANFDENWKDINNRLNNIAHTVPQKLEQLSNTTTVALGLDIGMSESGKLYMFEANVGPATSAVVPEVALLRADYYLYLAKKRP